MPSHLPDDERDPRPRDRWGRFLPADDEQDYDGYEDEDDEEDEDDDGEDW